MKKPILIYITKETKLLLDMVKSISIAGGIIISIELLVKLILTTF